jgi:hypothetical protein
MTALADIDDGFRLAASHIDPGNQRTFAVIDYQIVRSKLAGAFEPSQLDERAPRLVGR